MDHTDHRTYHGIHPADGKLGVMIAGVGETIRRQDSCKTETLKSADRTAVTRCGTPIQELSLPTRGCSRTTWRISSSCSVNSAGTPHCGRLAICRRSRWLSPTRSCAAPASESRDGAASGSVHSRRTARGSGSSACTGFCASASTTATERRASRCRRGTCGGFTSEHPAAADAQGAGEVEICYALIAAARRWYANSACRDAQVQANLARLALLH